jgi:hypothetical protein
VTEAVPVDDKINVCVVGEFTPSLPNARLAVLTPKVETEEPSCIAKVSETPPALAVRVAVVAVLTAVAVAVKPALVAPDATVTDAGTLTAELLLATLTAKPPLAAGAFKVTEQPSVPAPVIEPLVQLNPVSTGTPVPLKPTGVVVPFEELLVSANNPEAAPAAVGSNCTLRVAVCPEAIVSGTVAPEMENPAPVTFAALIVNGAVPVDDKVNVCAVEAFTASVPNDRLALLTPKVGTEEPSSIAKGSETLPALAVIVAVAEPLTAVTVAVNPALVAPDATVTDAGTLTAELLLARLTAKPPLAAAAFKVTEQLSVPAPVIEPLVQLSPLNWGIPVPLRLTAVEVPAEELLVSVNDPEAAPAAVGSNCTLRVAV